MHYRNEFQSSFNFLTFKEDLSDSRKSWKKYVFQDLGYLRVQDHFGHQKYSFCVEFALLFEYVIRIEKSDMEKTPKKSQRYWHRKKWKFEKIIFFKSHQNHVLWVLGACVARLARFGPLSNLARMIFRVGKQTISFNQSTVLTLSENLRGPSLRLDTRSLSW